MTLRAALVFAFLVLSSGCSQEQGDQPYVEFVGGGFVFNYRLAEADYGFVVKRLRHIPNGTVLEAVFEDPGGGEPIIVRETADWGRLHYSFRTPPVRGVKAHRDYRVELKLLGPEDGGLIASYSKTFRSDIDQAVLPKRPPVTGPGYHRTPDQGNQPRGGG